MQIKHFDLKKVKPKLTEIQIDELVRRFQKKIPHNSDTRADIALVGSEIDQYLSLLEIVSNFYVVFQYAHQMQEAFFSIKKAMMSKGDKRPSVRIKNVLTANGIGNPTQESNARMELAWKDFEILTSKKRNGPRTRKIQLFRVALYCEKRANELIKLPVNRVRARALIYLARRYDIQSAGAMRLKFIRLKKTVGVSTETIAAEESKLANSREDSEALGLASTTGWTRISEIND